MVWASLSLDAEGSPAADPPLLCERVGRAPLRLPSSVIRNLLAGVNAGLETHLDFSNASKTKSLHVKRGKMSAAPFFSRDVQQIRRTPSVLANRALITFARYDVTRSNRIPKRQEFLSCSRRTSPRRYWPWTRGLAGNMRRHYPVSLLYLLVGLRRRSRQRRRQAVTVRVGRK